MRTLLLFILIAVFASCEDQARNVNFKVTGTATSFFVTLTSPDGNTQQYDPVGSGTSWSAKAYSGNWVYLSAQNNTDQGSVTVTITVDGDVFKTATSSGAYVIASVDGDVP